VQVIDNEVRLRSTLSHEMCHVAAWVISKEWKEHHGSVFWEWAHRFEALVPDIKITTCHNFDVHAPFRWQCSNYRWAAGLVASLLIGAAA
jgi:predicted SprT family Zn-dependent metalloprotease